MAEEFGKLAVQYKLRDWVFSRQRYWGEPIPLIHCEDCGVVPVPDKDLPVVLPKVKKYEPTGTGESPLAEIKNWVKTKCPKCGELAWRETNTMPQWAGSSWYWLRYADPKNKKVFASIKKQKYWTPVDVYFGGMEHTTLHLLYSRFWNLFLADLGLVTQKEPFVLRKPHGIVLAADGEKMSKSRGNVVNPDDIVKSHGADTLRMYELFLGPHELSVSWNDHGVVGVKRFLDRVWEWANRFKIPDLRFKNGKQTSEKAEKLLHKLIKKITEDIENFRFNTTISTFMEFYNQVKDEAVSQDYIKTFLALLYPFAPHFCEELNNALGGKESLQKEQWPVFDPNKVIENTVEMVVQINGKVKGKISIARDSDDDMVKEVVIKLDVVSKALVGDSIKRVIVVKNKLVNLVI
ncbi:MAG: class I tRNA ligase family protein [Candidatus Doudnabacteria bacterium]|nr:class I tRNA ligase family protein [Candidatus Doudnabacteria bacterium]